MIGGELLALAKTAPAQSRKKFVEASKKLGMALVPATAKFAVNTVGHWAIGKADLGDDLAKSINAFKESSASSLEKLVAKRLEGYEADKRSVEGFKTALADLARDGEKPIVIFLDGLDRCRPDFAVRTIERMKHFFEAPKVVFVLLINRKQLVAAVQGIYGQQIDANAYLAKFVQLSLALPKKSSADMHTPDDNQRHCDATLVRYGFDRSTGNNQFAVAMGVLASLMNMSLRDVERAVALYSLAQPLNATAADAAWPIAIKLSEPDLLAHLLKDERSAHQAAETLARNMRARTNSISPILDLFVALHHSGGTGFVNPMPDEQFEQLGLMYRTSGPRGFLLNLFNRMELDISR